MTDDRAEAPDGGGVADRIAPGDRGDAEETWVARDGVPENRHPLNRGRHGDPSEPDRIPLFEVYMRMAEELAGRSTCARLQVGTVLTDARLENVVAIGYNGNARGFPNRCDSTEPGKCGCIHSEQNALVKAPGALRDKVAFVTASPCVMCAKLMIQANVAWVFYRTAYRDRSGLDVLERGGVRTVRYTRWRDHWRSSPPSGGAPAS